MREVKSVFIWNYHIYISGIFRQKYLKEQIQKLLKEQATHTQLRGLART